ncbi:MAG TPA: DNA polymerase III subunit alpha [candidate division Zixibacteria bacterium]|nr:DNA polymerase III subunit alpha [candidate division Zixibacteria bacterium]
MKNAEFVHLHTHSQYSLLDGACKLDDVIAIARENKMPAVAITDHGNMFGAVEFYQKAIAAGIKPIIGMEAYVSAGPMTDRKPHERYPTGGFHLLLLAKTHEGYQNLIKIASAGYLEGFYHRPRIDHDFLRAHSAGLIATSACPQGEVNWHLIRGEYDNAKAAAERYSAIFGADNFFLEMQNHGLDLEAQLMPEVVKLAGDTKLPLVVSNDCHYLRREDAEAHDALLCIQTGKLVEDQRRLKYDTDQIYFKSPQEMRELFGDFPEACANTVRIAEECNVELEFDKLHLPHFPIPKPFVDPDEFLRKLTEEGLSARYAEITEIHTERLNYELDVIKRLGYAGYFLITKDFCDYARSVGVRVGPGRGSAAGSLVSYTLGITSLDPIKYSLLFERFLNPERISMPDIDIDFADRGRDKIIEYVIEKYGKENVTQIITFGTMAARGVLRDVGRVLSMPYGDVDKIAKMVPFATDMTLERALEQNPDLKKLAQSDPQVGKLIDYGKRLEGLTRHASTHAAGVVIAPSALTDFVPLFKGSNDEITTQFDMKSVEKIGLLKMDFLGLRTLTVIDDAVRMIETRTGGRFDIDNIPLDDPKVFELFARGQTVGVFQFESSGMRDYLRKLKPEVFDDLVAMNALYRPGPLDSGMIDVYIQRKHEAAAITYDHPILEQILKNTYGVIVFQEQVLQIANRLAGYSMGKADLLRKAMGKKDSALMAEQKKEFLAGCDKNNIDPKLAATVFEQIETFARYGFNKAHSVCYGFVAYQTAYLKTYYPLEFFAACMTSEIESSDRINTLMEECRLLGITVMPPDVNESKLEFTVVEEAIRFGLLAVKNVGEASVRAIEEARAADGEFASLANFCARVNSKAINRRTLESLIYAGATDSLPGNRQQKVLAVEKMLEYGARAQEVSSSHDLFGEDAAALRREPPLPEADDFPTGRALSLEKETLGFYVSGHPLESYRNLVGSFVTSSIAELAQARDGAEVRVAGIFTGVKALNDKRGKRMAFATLEDFTGSTELICFSDCYEQGKDVIVENSMALAVGRISTREGEMPKVLANEVVPLNKLMERFDCQLVIKVGPETADEVLEEALRLLEGRNDRKPLLISYRINGSEALIRSKKYRIDPDEESLSALRGTLGEDSVYLAPHTGR